MIEKVFEARDLGYTYPGDIEALQSVNLSIQAGERVAFLGANGCGKSTLLWLLDGLLFPTRGELLAFGQPLSEDLLSDGAFAFSFRRRVGMVFQDPDIQLFSATVGEEVAFGLLQLGFPRSEMGERLNAALELLGIQDLRERPPYRLSTGEKKKVALASVLALEPQVLLMDEPTAGLDPKSQSWLVEFLKEWHKGDRTIVTSTHDLDTLNEMADTVYILDEAHRLAAEGTPEGVLAETEFLLRTNLIHEHSHRHNGTTHTHFHRHVRFHEHKH
jgi:cobalt/nickel transport system ATP-binding protein